MELFNLESDIAERRDLSQSHPEQRDHLLKLLQEWWLEIQAPIPNVPNPEFALK